MDAVFVPGATREDLSMDAVRKYMRRSVEKRRRAYSEDDDPWEVLQKLEWVKSETEITRAAYLLFAKDTQRKFSQAIVHSGAFRADGALIVDSRDSKGNIQDQIDDVMAFIQKNIHCALVITPGKIDHDPVWDYPLDALRETLANAICHRDYGVSYDIQVKILEDSLRISSPGQLPFDMPMEFLMNPAHPSRPRNKIIAQAFFDMGIIERYGSGIKRIKRECDKNGNPYPEWSDLYGEFATTYRPRFVNGKPQLDHRKDNSEQGDKKSDKKSDKKILEFIKNNPMATIQEMQDFSGLSSGGIRKAIYRLKTENLLRRVGPDKGGHWEVVEGK